MNLPGQLRLTTLGDVLGVLHREGATGVLELTEAPGHVHRVHWERGLLGPIESSRFGPRLGDLLKRRGLVDDETVERARARLPAESRTRLGEVLVRMSALSDDELVLALTVQRRERLEALFAIRDARIAFRVAGPRNLGLSAPLEPRDFLVGRARRRDRAGARTEPAVKARRRDPVRTRALATLGLGDTADASSVKRAFRALASKMHPDRHPKAAPGDRAELVRRFAELSAAYHALVA